MRFAGFLKQALGGDYPVEALSADEIRKEEPMVGGETVGATFYPHDGHVNPLQLLQALAESCQKRGLAHYLGERLLQVSHDQDGFHLKTEKGLEVQSEKVCGTGGQSAGAVIWVQGVGSPPTWTGPCDRKDAACSEPTVSDHQAGQ